MTHHAHAATAQAAAAATDKHDCVIFDERKPNEPGRYEKNIADDAAVPAYKGRVF